MAEQLRTLVTPAQVPPASLPGTHRAAHNPWELQFVETDVPF